MDRAEVTATPLPRVTAPCGEHRCSPRTRAILVEARRRRLVVDDQGGAQQPYAGDRWVPFVSPTNPRARHKQSVTRESRRDGRIASRAGRGSMRYLRVHEVVILGHARSAPFRRRLRQSEHRGTRDGSGRPWRARDRAAALRRPHRQRGGVCEDAASVVTERRTAWLTCWTASVWRSTRA